MSDTTALATQAAPRGVVKQHVPDDVLPSTAQMLRIGPPNELIKETAEANRAAVKSRVYWLYPTKSEPTFDFLVDEKNNPLEWLFNMRLTHIETVLREGSGKSFVIEKLNAVIESEEVSYMITCAVDSSYCRTFVTGLVGMMEADGIQAPFHLRTCYAKNTTAEQMESDLSLAYYANLRIPGVRNDDWRDNYYKDTDLQDNFDTIRDLKRKAKTKTERAEQADAADLLVREQVLRLQAAIDEANGVIDA